MAPDTSSEAPSARGPSSSGARRWAALAAAALTALLAATTALAEEPAAPAPAPLPELGEELTVEAPSRLRAPPADGLTVRMVEREELEAAGARTLQEALEVLPGIHLVDEQGNGWQQDLTMRGFVASPVTGLAQGVSVFVDGVRVNEPAAEEVNFDLVPLSVIERLEIIRGPSAIFGRNTLGGAINVVTRRGQGQLEVEAEALAGSFGRRGLQGVVSGPLGPLDGFLSVVGVAEDGWRDASAGRAAQAFGKVGLKRTDLDATLSVQLQRDRIEQAGSLPVSLLAVDRRANYTTGDFFQPSLALVTLSLSGKLAGLTLTGNAFGRALDAEQYNSSFLSPDSRLFNKTRSLGGAAQAERLDRWAATELRLTLGGEATLNDVRIRVFEEPNGQFPTAEDGSPLPRLLAELTDDQLSLAAFAQAGLRFTDGPAAGLGLTASLRWDRIGHDILDTSPVNTGGATGAGSYQAVIPALGAAWTLPGRWLATASVSGGFRAPAFLEITCASPDAPCVGLQAGVAPDATFTDLKPVRSVAVEAGLRNEPVPGLALAASVFRVDLRDDIYAVTPAGTTSIYFKNVGRTRRQGLEATAQLRSSRFDADLAYDYTRATFQSEVEIATARTPTGTQLVLPGADLPLVPRHRLDLEVRHRPLPWLTLSLGGRWVGSQVLRGDEANEAGRLPAYGTLRAGLQAASGRWSLSARVENLLDAKFETFGTYAPDGKSPGQPVVQFLTPGLPLRFQAWLRWELG